MVSKGVFEAELVKKDNNQKKRNAGIYLWKLIVIIAAIFAIVLSTECFFLIEKTVKEIIGGTAEEYSTSTTVTEPKEELGQEENKDNTNKGENIDNSNNTSNSDDNNTNKTSSDNNTNTADNSNTTNTTTNTVTNIVTNTTNTANTNTISNTIGNTTSTNTVNTNTVDTDKIIEEEPKGEDTLIQEKLVCKKIHEHLKICYLEQYTEEDRENVFAVIQMIDELPDYNTISEKLNSFEEAGDDKGYSEYYLKITEQVKHVYSYYAKLKSEEKDLREYVTNSEKLVSLYSICEISDMAVQTEVNAQYYAWIERVERGDPIPNKGNVPYTGDNLLPDNILAIIDTSAEKNGGQVCLPKNGTGRGNTPVNSLIQSIKNTGPSTGQMTGKISYVNELTKIYTGVKYEMDGHTNIEKFNRFDGRETGYYTLDSIWVLKDGKSADSVVESDWDVYKKSDIDSQGMYFTDYQNDTNPSAIHLKNGAVIRYVCTLDNGSYENETLFYDYDITDGFIYSNSNDAASRTNGITTSTQKSNPNTKYWAYTKESGINSHENYLANSDIYTPGGAKLAFGNSNSSTGTNLGDLIWNQLFNDITYTNRLNMANVNSYDGNASYMIGTYGLTQDLKIVQIEDPEGNVIETRRLINYSHGINAPFLFNNGEAKGKTVYNDLSLRFARNGDTYVLDSVLKNPNDEEKETGAQSTEILSNLSVLEHPTPDNGKTIHKHIWTNNFWPMDHVSSYGGDGHDLIFGNLSKKDFRKFNVESTLPTSDDGEDHNGYFGMQLSLDFYMVSDYEGPLEYYFFGDDDLWVYLDGKLICDLGGVHTAVGEYTNLWDYIQKGDNQKHTLAIYYTERGASGSTCWMHFNLPHPLAGATPDSERGDLTVQKQVVNSDLKQRYYFEITITDENGNILPKRYDYITNSGRKGLIGSKGLTEGSGDGEFYLLPGESITIKGIPKDSEYTIKEVRTAPHNDGETAIPLEHFAISSVGETGTIIAKTEVNAKFTNVYNHTFAKVEKVWDDDNNSAGTRPEQITVKLNAKTIDGIDCSDYITSVLPNTQFEVNLNASNEWKYEWTNLPKYKVNALNAESTSSDEIIYTIDEIQTEELAENYFVLSKIVRDNTTIITNAIYKNIELTKVDTEDETKLLAGAQFKLEKLLNDDDDTDMTIDTNFEPMISKVTEADGKFSFEKLKFGRYLLTEIKTPEGYNTIKKPIVINVRQNVIKLINPTSLLEQITEFETEGKITIDLGKIGNRKGITLTETGGTGTKIFTITGLAILITSLMLINPKQKISISESAKIRRKKRMAKKNRK